MTLIYLFPGQGSQKLKMGSDLFDKFPHIIQEVDQVLGYSIKELCLDDPNGKLNNTQYTQPALFVVNALTFLDKKNKGEEPEYAAGHSLGEYNALFAAGAFDIVTGTRLVKKRGELMGAQSGGGMSAVIGLSGEKIQKVLDSEGFGEVDLANHNSPKQIVISGKVDDLTALKPHLESAGAQMVIPLKVSAPFHSRFMTKPSEEFAAFLEGIHFNSLKIPVIANINAKPYQDDQIKNNLAKQINSPVLWVQSMQYLLNLPDPQFEEVGPGNVLTGLTRQIKAGAGQ